MKAIRVLVAEDSPTLRRYLGAVLARHEEFAVVGEADNGADAVAMAAALKPDVITLDVLMPDMDGLRATELIMARHPTPILVVSTVVGTAGSHVFDLIAAGAIEAQDKPARLGDPAWERRFVANLRMVSRIKAITHVRAALGPRAPAAAPATPASAAVTAVPAERRPRLLAIGASTGGPTAIAEVLKPVARWCAVPVLVVLHLGDGFGEAWRDWLAGQCRLPVRNVDDDEPLPAGPTVLLAPAGRHLALVDGHLRLDRGPERHGCRPSVDVLFESLVPLGGAAVGCLLTGMGRDGAQGLLAMRRAGAHTIAEHEATCVVYGMPREAVQIGAACEVLPLDAIPARLRALLAAPVAPGCR